MSVQPYRMVCPGTNIGVKRCGLQQHSDPCPGYLELTKRVNVSTAVPIIQASAEQAGSVCRFGWPDRSDMYILRTDGNACARTLVRGERKSPKKSLTGTVFVVYSHIPQRIFVHTYKNTIQYYIHTR